MLNNMFEHGHSREVCFPRQSTIDEGRRPARDDGPTNAPRPRKELLAIHRPRYSYDLGSGVKAKQERR